MSTKIYHGYRLAKGTDVWEFTRRLREQGNRERDRLDMDVIEKFAEAAIAERIGTDKPVPDTPDGRLMLGYQGWSELMRTLGNSRISDPHQLDVVFIMDGWSNRIYALLYAGSKIEKVFTEQPEVEPWGYWDNTDPDENCTEQEWEDRRRAWERCLPGWSPPAAQGLTFQLRCDPTDGIIEMIYRDKV